jgi:hypothetical protein
LDQGPALADPGSDHHQSLEIEALSCVLKLKARLSWRDLAERLFPLEIQLFPACAEAES